MPVLPGTDGRRPCRRERRSSRSMPPTASCSRRSPAAAAAACGWSREQGELADAFARAAAEAKAAFGNGDLYAERLIGRARHIEVQIVGDGTGGSRGPGRARMHPAAPPARRSSSWRPARHLAPACGNEIVEAAVAMAKAVGYRSLGTFEFLVDGDDLLLHRGQRAPAGRAYRHRGGVGRRSGEGPAQDRRRREPRRSGLEGATPRGHAIQLRVNMETMTEDGSARPAAARSPSSSRRRGRGCASTPTATPATAPTPTSIRCWPS